jgi:hypothetical protein
MKMPPQACPLFFVFVIAVSYSGYDYYDSRAPAVSVELEADLSEKLKQVSPIDVVSTGVINAFKYVRRCEVIAIGEGASKSDAVAKWGCIDKIGVNCPEMTITYSGTGGAIIKLHESKYDHSKDSVVSCAKLAIKNISTVRIPTSEKSDNAISWDK